MFLPTQFNFSTVTALTAIFFTACCADFCGEDLKGSVGYTHEKKLQRVYLEPYNELMTFSVPKVCVVTQGLRGYACAPDAKPYVRVKSFQEVIVQRNGSPSTRIPVDITAYCNVWGRSSIDTI